MPLTDYSERTRNPRRRPGASKDMFWRIQNVAPASLIAYWPGDELSGTASINYGAGGTARNGAYTGATLGYYGIGDGRRCPYYDAAGDRINVFSAGMASAFTGQEFTVLAVVKVSSAGAWTDGVTRTCAHFYTDANNTFSLSKPPTSNIMQFYTVMGGVSKNRQMACTSTGWVQAVGTVSLSGDKQILYLNGVASAAITGIGTWTGAITAAHIGSSYTGLTGYWSGNLAHIAVWSTPLSANQVSYLYSGGF